MDTLYVSGAIYNKSIQFYREKIINYDGNFIVLDFGSLGNDGSFQFTPWEDELKQKLISRQELAIRKEADIIRNFGLNNKPQSFKQYIHETLNIILKTKRNLTFALLECFYKVLYNVSNNGDLLIKISKLRTFMDYLEELPSLTQTDLNYLIYLFFNNYSYDCQSLLNWKQDNYNLIYQDLDSTIRRTLSLGEMLAPERIKSVAYDIHNNPRESNLVLPIFFCLKDPEQAYKWLRINRGEELDLNTIEKNAQRMRIPNNLFYLARR